ncbi:hypothetical protein SteCoe_21918 [Stentor coeruleus]|uniref:G-protein coupled receptors family 2 profile 2 domain-containing protein n=1 Tax=Stentor coeruleus TaxID=5963 RepID=A0A1R2BNG0_9CILI|nr:hypothetical protein SteCoe_21918 [Stentor coeruleus]
MVYGISDGKLEDIYVSNAIASILSILGCAFIISMYLIFKDLRKLAFKLIAVLSVFDLINAISFMIPTYNQGISDEICIIQGILMNFSTFGAILWTSFIAITLYAIVVKSYLNIEWLMKRYIIFDIFVAMAITAIPNILESRNSSNGFCWLYQGAHPGRYTFRFLTFLVPLWVVLTINLSLYVVVFRHLRGGIGGEDAKIRKQLSKKIGIYPLIIFFCYLPYTIKGIIEVQGLWDEFIYEYYFTLIAGVIRCLIGLLNAFAYGFTKNVRKKLKHFCSKNKYDQNKSTLMTDMDKKNNYN